MQDLDRLDREERQRDMAAMLSAIDLSEDEKLDAQMISADILEVWTEELYHSSTPDSS